MPLLFYSVNIIFNKGIDVACIEYSYSTEDDYQRLSRDEQRDWLYNDVGAAFDAIVKEGKYDSFIFVAKSLGTLAVGKLLEENEKLSESQIIWLTPILSNEKLRQQITVSSPRSLFVIGTADPYYDENLLDEMKEITKGDILVIQNANHGLEIPDSIWDSIEALEVYLRLVDKFV